MAEPVTLCDLRELPRGRREKLCRAFFESIYLPNFPEPSIQESPEVWLPLLSALPAPPLPILHMILALAPENGPVLGGLLCEYYQRSGSALATYLVVDAQHRRHGIGRRLLEHGRDLVTRDAGRPPDRPPLLFAETEDPRRAGTLALKTAAQARMRALSRLGFLATRLPYVQPPLSPRQRSVDWLCLLVHRSGVGPSQTIPAASLRAFLGEFYRALGDLDPESGPDLGPMIDWLASHDPVSLAPIGAGVGGPE